MRCQEEPQFSLVEGKFLPLPLPLALAWSLIFFVCSSRVDVGNGGGNFFAPTVLVNTDPESDCVQEEIFGPLHEYGLPTQSVVVGWLSMNTANFFSLRTSNPMQQNDKHTI